MQVHGLWSQVLEWARSAKLESISLVGLNITFDSEAFKSEAFRQVLNHLASRAGKPRDVFVLSAHNLDEVTFVDRIDADHECEALGPTLRSPGGSGANTAFGLSRLGSDVAVAGLVGVDPDGDLLVASLRDAGVNISLLKRSNSHSTGHTTTLVEEGGERFIVVYPNANNHFAAAASFETLLEAARNAKILHLSSFVGEAELRLQERLVATLGADFFVSLSPGALYAKQGLDRLEPLLRHVRAMFLYREQLEELISASSARSLKRGAETQSLMEAYFEWKQRHRIELPQVLVVKDKLEHSSGNLKQRFLCVGVGGSALEQFISPAPLPRGARIRPVDTTGTGDAAAAGFLHAMLLGTSLGEAADRAFLLAGFASTQFGARAAFCDRPAGLGESRPDNKPSSDPSGLVPSYRTSGFTSFHSAATTSRMTLDLDRRLLLKAGTLGLGALAVPGVAQIAAARGFAHGVASGEPRQRSVMLWTRHVPGGRLHWQVSRTRRFRPDRRRRRRRRRGRSTIIASSRSRPAFARARWYHYRFRDGRGAVSPVGRTRTLPEGRTPRFTLGIFSCANLAFGFFNAYAHAAARRDLDLLVHLGDYFYEFERGKYPSAREALAGRILDPATEAVALADYRLRHAAYRADPDLQRLHASRADGDDVGRSRDRQRQLVGRRRESRSGEGRAVDRPQGRGPARLPRMAARSPTTPGKATRSAISPPSSARRPGSPRAAGRSSMPKPSRRGEDLKASLMRFRDGAWRDPERTMLGSRAGGLAGRRVQALGGAGDALAIARPADGDGLAGRCRPRRAPGCAPTRPSRCSGSTALGAAASEVGLPLNLDAWDGYPAARERLLRSALDADANLLVLSGDSHNGWAFDLDLAGAPAGAEFAGMSVTSPGLEAYAPGIAPADVERAVRRPQPGAQMGRRSSAAAI